MVRVIEMKILGVGDLWPLQASSTFSGIDLGMSKSKIKFSNVFSLDPRMS